MTFTAVVQAVFVGSIWYTAVEGRIQTIDGTVTGPVQYGRKLETVLYGDSA